LRFAVISHVLPTFHLNPVTSTRRSVDSPDPVSLIVSTPASPRMRERGLDELSNAVEPVAEQLPV
jgi:hypothetical protein